MRARASERTPLAGLTQARALGPGSWAVGRADGSVRARSLARSPSFLVGRKDPIADLWLGGCGTFWQRLHAAGWSRLEMRWGWAGLGLLARPPPNLLAQV